MTLSERIRAAMIAAEISQTDLARACGVKPPSVHGWLTGKAKFLRGENLLKAARALGVSQDWLATGKGEMHQLSQAIPASPGANSANDDQKPSGGLADALKLTCETAEELQLLSVFRLANKDEREAIGMAVESVRLRLRRGMFGDNTK